MTGATVESATRDEDAPILALRDVTKIYGSLAAVQDVTLLVAPGERRALIGPNGAGKTTLFNIVGGSIAASQGEVVFRERRITRSSEHRRAQLGMGRMFQHSALFDGLTAFETVALAVRRHHKVSRNVIRGADSYKNVRERSMQVLEEIDLADRADVLGGSLSHGERRQLQLAQTLALEPSLLLLDEPTAGMSSVETSTFVDIINRISGSLTMLIIEHDMDVVFELASRITVMDAGELLFEGTPDEVARSEEVQAAYLGAARPEDIFRR